jgi:RNA ligase (TIGR02306 family)
MVAELKEHVNKRSLVTARTIDGLFPIEGADAIEVAQVDGWKVVVKKGEFNVNDPCLYFEIDSFLPEGNPAWQFLVDKQPKVFNGVRGHKLRTIKLRGQISQGFVVPYKAFPIVVAAVTNDTTFPVPEELRAEFDNLVFGMHEHEAQLDARDMDFSDLLGVTKWEVQLAANLQGQAEGLFPSFIQKTDQERCQNLKNEIFGYEDLVIPANEHRPEIVRRALASPDDAYEITVKLDGSSMTAFGRGVIEQDGEQSHLNIDVGVCSRNLQLKVNEANAENSFIKTSTDSGLLQAIMFYVRETGESIAVQGELMGPNIQGNREQLTKAAFYLFDVYLINEGRYATPIERGEVFRRLVELGAKIEHTPIKHAKTTLIELGLKTIDDLLKFAEGPSIKHPIREGLVFKRLDGKFSFKAISNKYLEKEKD